jgi:iron complex outermembrane receptor protein
MKNCSFVIICILWSISLQAQVVFRGQVTDENSQPLSDVHVYFEELKKGTLTNDSGFFFMPVQNVSVLNIQLSHLGYQKIQQKIKLQASSDFIIQLTPKAYTSSTYVITATRNKQEKEMIPASVDIIDQERLESQSASNTDNYLQSVSGVFVNRSGGIFARNASVSLRGLGSSARTLILLDGVPLNHTAGGTINWHMMSVDEIQQIEVIKGPASAVYGMNAMGGVINILTKNPKEGLGAEATFGFGNYNTSSQNLYVHNTHQFKKRKLYWSFNVSNKKGDGYYLIPENLIDWFDAPLAIRESKASVKIGSKLSATSSIENNFFLYDDIRFSGVDYFEPRGSFEKFKHYFNNLTYTKLFGKTFMSVSLFAQREDYYRLNEKINNSDVYKLTETYHIKDDLGIWLKFNRTVFKKHLLTAGIDLKNGLYDGEVIYRTTTDILNYGGNILFTGIYVQDEFSLFKDKLNINMGIRFDHVKFSKGRFSIDDPTGETGFIQNENHTYQTEIWKSVSPKIGINYKLSKNHSVYVSASKGFMPPKTDDLVRSGKISKGFKIANPLLQPETLINYEAGFNSRLGEKLSMNTAVFQSYGTNFMYLMKTGDSIDMGDDTYRQIMTRQNVAEIEIFGVETAFKFDLTKNISLQANYTYNSPKIVDYSKSADVNDASLIGKFLIETPIHQVFSSINWKNKYINTSISCNYIGEQYIDDLNEYRMQDYYLIDIRLNKAFGKHLFLNLDIQNLLNQKYLDRKENQSIGRFILLTIKYKI